MDLLEALDVVTLSVNPLLAAAKMLVNDMQDHYLGLPYSEAQRYGEAMHEEMDLRSYVALNLICDVIKALEPVPDCLDRAWSEAQKKEGRKTSV